MLIEFADLMSKELLQGLPSIKDIQHQIDLVSMFSLPNKLIYRPSPKKAKEMQRKVMELLEKYIQNNTSLGALSVLLVLKNNSSW